MKEQNWILASSYSIRQSLLDSIRRKKITYQLKVTQIPKEVTYIYEYYYKTYLSEFILTKELETQYVNHPISDNNNLLLIEILRNEQIILPSQEGIFAAWLTIDNWRLHEEYPNEEIPEGLSYGLVLQYPRAIIKAAQSLINSEDYIDNLDLYDLEYLKRLTVRSVLNHYSEVEQEEILTQLSIYT